MKTHSLYEIFRHEQDRVDKDVVYKKANIRVSYDEDKDILQYNTIDGTLTVTFNTQNNHKEPTSAHFKFNEELHPVGQMFEEKYDIMFNRIKQFHVPELDSEYGTKLIDLYPWREGVCGRWSESKKCQAYDWAMEIAGEWGVQREKVGLFYTKKELEMLKD